MTEWLLILTFVHYQGVAVTTTKVGDEISCKRAGLAFMKNHVEKMDERSVATRYTCVEVKK